MNILDLEAFRAAPLNREPFEYLVLPHFIKAGAIERVNKDYPQIKDSGSHPVGGLTYGPGFAELKAEMEGEEFRKAFEEKFAVDLSDAPTTLTARGRCSPRDGQIHTDSKSKILTILIYMNGGWEAQGGRLRLLRSGDDLENMILEVPPAEGTLVAFKRSENSWHGHKPFDGPRRVLQWNWVTGAGSQKLAMFRHNLSAFVKKALSPFRGGRKEEEVGAGRM